jgi:hypothetical protein
LIDETIIRYPGQQAQLAGSIAAFREDWKALAQEKGYPRFVAGVRKARMECKFFPCVAEIIERIPAPNTKAVMRYLADCPSCSGCGWKYVGPDAPSPDNPNPKADRVKRCHCAQIVYEEKSA